MDRRAIKDRLTAGLLSLALVASLFLVVIAADTDPTIHIDGLELRMVAEYQTDASGQYILDGSNQKIPVYESDGVTQKRSVQALVSVSVRNVPNLTGVTVPLFYNMEYLYPSDWVTNGRVTALTTNDMLLDDADPLHHAVFRTDENLYGEEKNGTMVPADPFDWGVKGSLLATNYISIKEGVGVANPENNPDWAGQRGVLSVVLNLKSDPKDKKKGEATALTYAANNPQGNTPASYNKVTAKDYTKRSPRGTYQEYYLNVGTTVDDRTPLGTFSFRVNEEYLGGTDVEAKLRELVDKFNETDGTPNGGDTVTAPLLSVYRTTGGQDWELKIRTLRVISSGADRIDYANNIQFNIEVDSDDVITKARPVNKEVTINAYEAFTDGRISDLALAMQKYAEDIRVTYVSNKEADMSIYWGDPVDNPTSASMPSDGPGMFIQKVGSADVYRFTWDTVVYGPGSTFTFEQKQPNGTFTPVDPTLIYDPRGGQYMISQYFTYWEKDGIPGTSSGTGTVVLKTLPIPVEVKLTVVPVTAVDAVVDKEDLTYRNDMVEVPSAFDDLDLAEEARLVLDTALNGVVPTVPTSWEPVPKPTGWTAGTLDHTITGTPRSPNTSGSAQWPVDSQDFTDQTGIGDYTFHTRIDDQNTAKTGVRDLYPWLTTSPWLSAGSVTLGSYRHIVDAQEEELASRYVMYVGPIEINKGDEIGLLQVTIGKTDEDGNFVDMAAGYKFRLFMPNGMEIITTGTNSWFTTTVGDTYSSNRVGHTLPGSDGSHYSYDLVMSPGALGATNNYATEREILRRYINLGGWFGAKVQAPGETTWTDMIMAFSQPRTNLYTKSYVVDPSAAVTNASEQHLFDYTGLRSGLMPFTSTSTLTNLVTLPADDSVETRYDGFTGAQPGNLRQFAVDRWDHVLGDKGSTAPNWQGEEIVTYGQNAAGRDLFARSFDYSNYGTVVNPDLAAPSTLTGYPVNIKDRQIVLKLQVPKEDPTPEKTDRTLLLTYEQNAGDSINYVTNTYGTAPNTYTVDEVKRVTFDNKLVNYTYQQIVTLTLTNAGDADIRGLHVDIPTLPGADGPYFKLVTAPPPVLPAGAKATFQISYMSNLPVGTYENIDATIPIHIWHDDCGAAPAKNFEAVLRVTKSKPHRVKLVVRPDVAGEGRIMGDAELVEGITEGMGGAKDSYSYAIAPDTYIVDDVFWVITTPKDEYELFTAPYYYSREPERDNNGAIKKDSNGNIIYQKVYLTEYAPGTGTQDPKWDTTFRQNAGNGDRNRLYYTTMPDYGITVYVDYFEPLYSKLRLSDLIPYAWDQRSDAKWDGTEVSHEKDLHDTAAGGYQVIQFDPKKDEYIVILEDMDTGKDNWCGLSVTLRALETQNNGVDPQLKNQDIKPAVEMRLDDGPNTQVGGDPAIGNTVGPTTHHSTFFEAPYEEDGQNTIAQKTVTITISYTGTDLNPKEGYTERVYKVRFVRKGSGEAKHIALAGNSPYGMIENEGDYTDADKAAAKAAFDVANRFDASYTPHQAKDLTNIYWPEAWGDGPNYDKDETALFVYLGQDFYDPGAKNIYNNAGDYIDGIMVERSLESWNQMDTTKTTAYDRFDNGGAAPVTAPISLGKVPAIKGQIPGKTVSFTPAGGSMRQYNGLVTDFAAHTDIRPGVYRLTYTFVDYDGTTSLSFTRPLIVLSPNGDVEANLLLNSDDSEALLHRFRTALPLELPTGVFSKADQLLYRYRILDANNDRNINNVDANLIRRTPGKVKQFYRPTEYTCPVQP